MQRTDKARKIKAFEKYSNIQELLNNWYEIRMHCKNATIDYEQVEAVLMKSLIKNDYINPDTHIRSITRSKQYTQILISHIERMIAVWEAKCDATYGGRIKRRIIRQFYFEYPTKTLKAIAVQENKPDFVIAEYHQKALKELSALIFGADGLLKIDGAMYIHIGNCEIGKSNATNTNTPPKSSKGKIKAQKGVKKAQRKSLQRKEEKSHRFKQ